MKRTIALFCLATAAAFMIGADSENDALRQENVALKNQVLQLSKMPLRVRMRKAVFGPDNVFQFLNYGEKPLNLSVHLSSIGHDTITNFELTLPAATPSIREVGHLQGWPALATDKIKVDCDGYPEERFNMTP
jgi:hypothetical protein